MKLFVLLTALLTASGAQAALSCRSLTVLGVFATKSECEKARLEKMKWDPDAASFKCVRCD
jgi:hypothetical protein